MRLVLASNNAKKLAELHELLAPVGVDLVAQAALGVGEADEPHPSFVENALAKARHAAHCTGAAAIADDSGLCVDALGGAPGVISAHYAPIAARRDEPREALRARQDAANNALLLERLHGATDRRAHYVGVLVALRSAHDPEPLVSVGRWRGEIVDEARGSGGFGYDPLMFIASLGGTVAQLGPELKRAHSHRAVAAVRMRRLLSTAWQLG